LCSGDGEKDLLVVQAAVSFKHLAAARANDNQDWKIEMGIL
jgi:hypothetical protein